MGRDFVADKDYFADKDGNLVEANDPAKVTKVVGVGGSLTAEEAAKYGLSNESSEAESSNDSPAAAEDEEADSKKASKKSSKKGK